MFWARLQHLNLKLKRRRHTKIAAIVLLAALPVGLYLAARERASWRPKTVGTPRGHVRGVVFSPDGKMLLITRSLPLAGGAENEQVELWDVWRGVLLHNFSNRGSTAFLPPACFSPDSGMLAAASWQAEGGRNYSVVKVLEARTGKLLRTLRVGLSEGAGLDSPDVAFWPHSTRSTVLTAINCVGLKQWDVRTGKLLRTLSKANGPADDVAFSPDGKTLASSDVATMPPHKARNPLRLWDARSGKLLHVLETSGANYEMAFSPDGRWLASDASAPDGTKFIRLWDVRTGRLLRTIQPSIHGRDFPFTLNSLSFSPDGNSLAAGGSGSAVGVWDVHTGKLLRTLKGHNNRVSEVAFSPDGTTLVVGGGDGTVKLWRIR